MGEIEQRRLEMAELEESLMSGSPSFEILSSRSALTERQGADIVFFRLTGRAQFGIPPDVDLAEQPYCVDIDGLNTELARLVSIAQGGSFLAAGVALDAEEREVVALSLPVDVSIGGDLPPPPGLSASVLQVARCEAMPLLKKFFGHVQACRCGM